MFKAPAFMFPTKAILIDDDQFYAQLFSDAIGDKIDIHPIKNSQSIINQKSSDFLFLGLVPADQTQLRKIIYESITAKKVPFENLISAVVTDQHMLPMSGTDILNQITSPYVRKILISNFIDLIPDKEIDHLRNMGAIRAVLDKTDHLASRLPPVLRQCQIEFFSLLSNQFLNRHQHPLTDREFASVYIQIIHDFLPDFVWPHSSLNAFYFSKEKHQTSLKLFICTKENIEALLDSHRVENASLRATNMLRSGEFILAHEDPLTLDGRKWEKYLKPAKKIHGQLDDYLICTEMEATYV